MGPGCVLTVSFVPPRQNTILAEKHFDILWLVPRPSIIYYIIDGRVSTMAENVAENK